MAVIQPRPTRIRYQYTKFSDDRASFNVIFDVCDVQHVNAYSNISIFLALKVCPMLKYSDIYDI